MAQICQYSNKDIGIILCYLQNKSQNKTQCGILLKENDRVITDASKVCKIFADIFFPTVANWLRQLHHIEMSLKDFLSNVRERHEIHPSVKAIKDRHMENSTFDIKK